MNDEVCGDLRPLWLNDDFYEKLNDDLYIRRLPRSSEFWTRSPLILANGRGNSDGNLSVSESGFLNQREKSQFHPVQHLEFLGVNVNSIKMELTLPSENINKIICQCKDILIQDRVSILNFLGKLTSRLQWREINIYKEEETSRQIWKSYVGDK